MSEITVARLLFFGGGVERMVMDSAERTRVPQNNIIASAQLFGVYKRE